MIDIWCTVCTLYGVLVNAELRMNFSYRLLFVFVRHVRVQLISATLSAQCENSSNNRVTMNWAHLFDFH